MSHPERSNVVAKSKTTQKASVVSMLAWAKPSQRVGAVAPSGKVLITRTFPPAFSPFPISSALAFSAVGPLRCSHST